ncbi:MAG: AI-2E family transporter, partial [bacterium]|nr:AI-2E family transporter [bacterium]
KLVDLKIPKALVLVFVLFFIFILFYFLWSLIFSGASSFIAKFPIYGKQLMETIQGLLKQLKIPLSDVNSYIDNIDWAKSVENYTAYISTLVRSTFGSFLVFVGNLALVLLFLMFLLAGRNTLAGRVTSAFAESGGDKIGGIIDSIEDRVQHYLLIKTFISLLTGVLCSIILLIGGIDLYV